VVEPIVFRLKLQLQAERSVKEARHSWGNVLSGRPEDGVRRGPVGRRRRFLLLGDRLTARPKHSDFRERIFLRGKIKERRSSVEAGPSRKALQAFRDPAPMTEGARSFRRRGANAHRSPWSLVKSQDVGPAKSGQLNDAMQRPFTWRFRPTLFSRSKNEKSFFGTRPGKRIRATERKHGKLALGNYRHRSGRRAAVARRHRLPDQKSGKTGDEKASRGAPQTMPQMAWLFLKKRTAGTPARSSFELKLRD